MDWVFGGSDEDVLKLDCSDGCKTLGCMKNHRIVHFERVHFPVCRLFLNKAIKNIISFI